MGVTLSDTLDTPCFAPHGFKLSYVSTDYCMLKTGYFSTF